MRVELISDPRKIESIADEWDQLALSASEPNPFFERWVLEPAIEHLGKSAVSILTVWRGSRLVGLVPIVRRSGYRHLPISYTTIWRYLHCFLCTPLVRAGDEADFVHAIVDWSARSGEYLLELPLFAADGPFASALHARIEEEQLAFDRLDSYERAVFTSQADPSAYTREVIHGRHMKDLKRKSRILEEIGPVEAVTLSSEQIPGQIEDFLRLERSGWKGSAGTALAQSAADRAFFEDLVRRGAESDRVIMRMLTVEDKPAAMMVALRAAPGAFMFKVAYEERYHKASPGLLLEVDNIRFFSREAGVMWVDSCTAPDNVMLNRIWKDRRKIQTMVLATGSRSGSKVIGVAKALAAGLRILRGAHDLPRAALLA